MVTPFVTLPSPYKNQPCLILMPCGHHEVMYFLNCEYTTSMILCIYLFSVAIYIALSPNWEVISAPCHRSHSVTVRKGFA